MRLLDQRTAFGDEKDLVRQGEIVKAVLFFVIGALLLLFSAQALVYSASHLAERLGFSVGIVGLFLVALGTSLPELAFELQAIKRHEDSLVLGDLIGSVVTNSTLVLAITALVHPIYIPDLTIYITPIVFLALILIIFEIIVRQDKKLGVVEGLIFLFVYVFFLITEFGLEISQNLY
jgi:cation:H+ antiporter